MEISLNFLQPPDKFVGNEIQFNITGEKQTIFSQEKEVDTSSSDEDSTTAMDYKLLEHVTSEKKDFIFERKD